METKEMLIVALVGVMLLVVGLQTVQLSGLSQTQVSVPATTSAAPKAPSTSAPAVPTSLQNLPSMVGGC